MVDLSARRFELLDPLDFAADPFELVDLLAVPLEPVALVAVRFDPLELRAVLFAVVDVVELRFVGVVLAGVLSVPAAASPADPVPPEVADRDVRFFPVWAPLLVVPRPRRLAASRAMSPARS